MGGKRGSKRRKVRENLGLVTHGNPRRPFLKVADLAWGIVQLPRQFNLGNAVLDT